MTERTNESEWVAAMVELEEELGPVVPGGAQGGVVARHRRAQAARTHVISSAAARSRSRVRCLFQSAEKNDDRAA